MTHITQLLVRENTLLFMKWLNTKWCVEVHYSNLGVFKAIHVVKGCVTETWGQPQENVCIKPKKNFTSLTHEKVWPAREGAC